MYNVKTKAEFFADRYSYTVPVQGHIKGFRDTAILLITNDEAGYKVTLTGKCFGSYSSVLPENYENRALADGLMSYWKKGKALVYKKLHKDTINNNCFLSTNIRFYITAFIVLIFDSILHSSFTENKNGFRR